MDITIKEITINGTLPFTPSAEQAIYIEQKHDEGINAFIIENHEQIKKTFHSYCIDFCYLPLRSLEKNEEIYIYHNPAWSKKPEGSIQVTTKEFAYTLFNGDIPSELVPSIIIYQKEKSTPNNSCFLSVELSRSLFEKKYGLFGRLFNHFTKKKRIDHFEKIARIISTRIEKPKRGNDVLYSEVNWYDNEYWAYMKEHHELFAEIDLKIHQLQERGVDSLILKKILCKIVDKNRTISRLVITKDLKIILPDYQDMEIRMEPINKALFLLFLKHEEGIRLKELGNHRNELESLYTQLSHDDRVKRKESLDKLLDPTNNSVNEKISRIRQAFIAKFEEDLASNYFVTGERGEAKRITLNRDLVSWM
ncbi:MAG: hypothetical protein KBT32_09820 [Bacteroidales bacterium]|nr:hypothetical protein [Candidatus Physcocola equi]